MIKTLKSKASIHWLTAFSVVMLLMGMKLNENAGALRDPTEPPASFAPAKTSEVSYQSMDLSGIFIKANMRSAVIGGKVYHEGDAIGEYIITKIDVDNVELIDTANHKEVLRLTTPIKKAVSIKEE